MQRLLPWCVLLVPSAASAQALSDVAGLFNIMVGLMIVIAFLCFFGGAGMWFLRLGTYPTYRDEAINLMQWAVAILFTLAILLAVVRFVQTNAALASFLVGVVIVIAVAFLIVKLSQAKGADEDEH